MAKGLIDLFKEFHTRAVADRYPASSRAIYQFFLGELNAHFWATNELSYSERELAELVGLSNAQTHRAIQFLCDNGWIKTFRKTVKSRTFFKILSAPIQGSSYEADAKQTRGISGVSNYTCAKDFKDIKTERHKKNKTRARDDSLEFNPGISAETQKAWEDAGGQILTPDVASDLADLENSHGSAFVVKAIKRASKKNKPAFKFLYLKFLKLIINGMLKGDAPSERKPKPSTDWAVERLESYLNS